MLRISMREIKFRAWNKRIGWRNKDGSAAQPEMEYEGWVMYPNGECTFPESGWDINGPSEKPDEFILMQYTGLKDKNGKEIYEGDVIESIENGYIYRIKQITPISRHAGIDYSSPIGVRERDGSVLRSNGISENYEDDWVSNPEFYEVIGDIYQNPELIK